MDEESTFYTEIEEHISNEELPKKEEFVTLSHYLKALFYYMGINLIGGIIGVVILIILSGFDNLDLLDSPYLMIIQCILSIIVLFVFIILFRKMYIHDFFQIKINYKRILTIVLVGIGLYFSVNYILGYFSTTSNNSDSINQQMIVSVLQLRYGFLILIVTAVICAPIIEETLFRAGIFFVFKKLPIWFVIFISSFTFGSIHVVSEFQAGMNGIDLAMTLLPYFIFGLILSLVYYYSKKNIWASITLHMIFNLIAALMLR